MKRTILILEDNSERLALFHKAVSALGDDFEVKNWRDAPSMIAECEALFPTAALISLDHDLNPMPGATTDPGTGLDVARFLGAFLPVCPVLIHSSNTDCAWSMHNELRFAGWIVGRVGPSGADWIESTWLRAARAFLEAHPNTWPTKLPADHVTRMQRIRLSLDGLSVGDAFGECFLNSSTAFERWLERREPPPSPWFYTDDTTMALSIVRCLNRYGYIEQDALAAAFAREYVREPGRGYGGTAHGILQAIGEGTPWQAAAGRAFGGQGSCGNGGAMRAAPIGAYFADQTDRVIAEARASAEVTHAHPDGQTGAIAAALAAAWAVGHGSTGEGPPLIEFVLERLPQTETHNQLEKSLNLPLDASPLAAARVLGNGSNVIASDTIPFCLWCAARHASDYQAALWTTVSGFGDIDTNCAIVGGIVALSAGRESIPDEWLKAREPVHL